MAEPKKDFIEAIKEAIPRRGGRHTLRDLSDAQLWEIFLRWSNGESTCGIARWIHETVGKGSSVDSIRNTLRRFKPRIANLLVQIPTTGMTFDTPTPSTRQIERLKQDGDLGELITLRDMSRVALHRMLTEEAESGVTNPKAAQRQTSLAHLEKAVAKLQEARRKYPAEAGLTAAQKALAAEKFERFLNGPHVMAESAYEFLETVDKELQSVDEEILLAAGMSVIHFFTKLSDYIDRKYPEIAG